MGDRRKGEKGFEMEIRYLISNRQSHDHGLYRYTAVCRYLMNPSTVPLLPVLGLGILHGADSFLHGADSFCMGRVHFA